MLPAAIIVAVTAVIGVVVEPSRPALTAITLSASYQLVSGMRALWLGDFQPWSQVIPSATGVLALVIFAALFFRRKAITAKSLVE